MNDSRDKAIFLARQAYEELKKAGVPEEFASLMMSLVTSQRATFFHSFGSDTGCFIEFTDTDNSLTPVRMSFGVRRYKQSFFARCWHALKQSWAVMRGYDIEHSINLKPDDIRKLKDLLRLLHGPEAP